jgi:photosystem II stability/assembly factor-like uncharacterized protein
VTLPSNFHADSTIALSAEVALLGGHLLAPFADLKQAEAAIFRWSRDNAPERVYSGPGWIVCAAAADKTVWALAAVLREDRNGGDHRLLISTDAGHRFEERGAVPFRYLAQLVAISSTEAWVIGSENLIRTVDGGKTWQPVQAPGERNSVKERLSSNGNRVMLLGNGIRSTEDGGRTWRHHPVEGVHVRAIDGITFTGTFEKKLRVGRLQGETPQWLSTIDDSNVVPFRIVAEGSHLRIAVYFTDKRAERGVMVYESKDDGKHWKEIDVPWATQESLALGPQGSGFAVGLEGRLLHPQLRIFLRN